MEYLVKWVEALPWQNVTMLLLLAALAFAGWVWRHEKVGGRTRTKIDALQTQLDPVVALKTALDERGLSPDRLKSVAEERHEIRQAVQVVSGKVDNMALEVDQIDEINNRLTRLEVHSVEARSQNEKEHEAITGELRGITARLDTVLSTLNGRGKR